MTKLPPADPNGHAWRAYLAACNAHGTPSKESRETFDAWWKRDQADAELARKAAKRAKAKAIR